MIEKFKEYKLTMQENLKKSLLRGVTAMNLEAMTILEPESANYLLGHTANNLVDNVFASQISEIEPKHTNNIINQSHFNNYDSNTDREYKLNSNTHKTNIPNMQPESPSGGKNKQFTTNNHYENTSYISEIVDKKVQFLLYL